MKIVFQSTGNGTLVGTEWTGKCFNEDYARIYCITDGEAEIRHSGRTFLLEPGNFYLIPPGANMSHECRKSFQVIWFHFNLYLHGCVDIFNVYECDFVHAPVGFDKKREDIIRLLEQMARDDIFSQLQAKTLFLELISPFFLNQPKKRTDVSSEKIDRLLPVIDYIDKHLGKPLKLAGLAKMAAYECTYFSTVFKQVFGVSPIRYVQQKRIDQAQALLRNRNTKLGSIAEELGFVDAFHFSKTFKKISGQTPSDFREKQARPIP